MQLSRRDAIAIAVAAGLASVVSVADRAYAGSKRHALYGKWHVRCPEGHVDVVTEGTKQHKCETCHKQCFVGGKVTVMCPAGHANVVSLEDVDHLDKYSCREKLEGGKECGKECEGW